MGRFFVRRAALAAAAMAVAESAVAQDVVRLDDVIVTGSHVPVPSKEVGSAVTVITGEELRRKQVRLVSDALREVPGLAVSRNGPVGALTQIRLRGAEANQTLVLLNGIEMNDPSGASEFDISTLLVDDIERIEVLRGPQSAIYGSESIGGVINIVTRKGEGPTTVSGRIEGGSFDTLNGAASVSGGEGAFDYAVGVSAFRTDGVSSAPKEEGNSEKDGYENLTAHARLGWRATDFLEFEVYGRVQDSEVESDPQPAVAGVIRVVDGDVLTTSDQLFGRAQAKLTLFDGSWEQIVALGHAQDDQDTFTNGAQTFVADGRKTRASYQSNFFFDTPNFAEAEHVLTFLAEREFEAQKTASAFGGSDLDVVNHGFVAEYRIGLWDRLFLSLSGRFDDNDIFKNATTFRATAAYDIPSTGTRLHGSVGEGVKNPTLFELFGFGPNFVPNPNLKPERSLGWDVGVEQAFWDDRAVVDVTFFRNEITDLIQGAGNTAINSPGDSDIYGIEVSASAELTPATRLSGQFTWMEAEDANGVDLIRRPETTASVNLAHRFLKDRAQIDIGVDYHGEQEDLQFSNFFLNQTRVTLDDYTLVNVGASYEAAPGVEIFGRVENLLDQSYQDVFGFANPGVGAFIGVRARLGVR